MGDTRTAVAKTAPLPDTAAIERASDFAHEPFLREGEDPAQVLAPGVPRRAALDAALAEIEAGESVPTRKWRQTWSLMLGLERVLDEEEPHLVDGTVLGVHQIDALSGTLTALLAEAQFSDPDLIEGELIEGELIVDASETGEESLLGGDDTGEHHLGEDSTAEQAIDDLIDEPDFEEPAAAVDAWAEVTEADEDETASSEVLDDPNQGRRFWFEHATGAGKSVAALGFVEASRTGGVLILTHRRNLVEQFEGELRDRGYRDRIAPPMLDDEDRSDGPVTVETYQWFVRNAGRISSAYSIVICDEAHTALGDKTSASIRAWQGPIFIGMTATGALIARHVTDLFPTQTSRFDLAQAARRGVISPLRCLRIPPGPGVRTIAKVPLRKGEVDMEFDQEMLAKVLDQVPFNLAIADLYKTRFGSLPGVVYTAGVAHAHNVAQAFRDVGLRAQAVSGETPKGELARILADYERGEVDVLVNAQLLAEGWNSPRATVCMHLAPTASKRVYQQRVGRVTRRNPGKEAGIVVDFVHPATQHDDPIVTLHSLLDRDVYRGGAIVIGPVRRSRGRRMKVDKRVLPVNPDPQRRAEVFERDVWRIAVEHLDYGEQRAWAQIAGARVQPPNWRKARSMLHFDAQGELKREFLLSALKRNKSGQVRLRAVHDIASSGDEEAFDDAVDQAIGWGRDERREAARLLLQAIADQRIGNREQVSAWTRRLAESTRELHEEYAVQRWPETKRLLGLLVNSSGQAHARNAKKIGNISRDQDRRLAVSLLAAATAHSPEAETALREAWNFQARKPSLLAKELLRNFPKRGKGRRRRGQRQQDPERRAANGARNGGAPAKSPNGDPEAVSPDNASVVEGVGEGNGSEPENTSDGSESVGEDLTAVHGKVDPDRPAKSRRRRSRRSRKPSASDSNGPVADGSDGAGDGGRDPDPERADGSPD
ncbi:MAG: DEAD/DEAH box helicase family protein [Actinomycetes bacterium]